MKIRKILDVANEKTIIEEILSILNALPDDEVLTRGQLENRSNRDLHTGAARRQLSNLFDNRAQVTINGTEMWVYGNEKAIQNLRNRLAETK